jgi:phytoene/squalene synthetase
MAERFAFGFSTPHALVRELGSSDHAAIGDDHAKDLDSIRFVVPLPPEERACWMRRLRWIRAADRLAENERLHPGESRFSDFLDAWQMAQRGRRLARGCRDAELIREVRRELRKEPPALEAFSGYLEALDEYTWRDVSIATLAEHDTMLDRVSGNLFAFMPYLSDAQRRTIRGFGMLDHFYNNLRDLAEDGAQRICYFPHEVLAKFSIDERDVRTGAAVARPSWSGLMHFWLDEYLPTVRDRARPFLEDRKLAPSVASMRADFLGRYARVLFHFRDSGFDPAVFTRRYWQGVG